VFTIFAMLLIQVTQRCFSLIHEIPDKVLRYIGGGAENLGEAQGEGGSRMMFAAAVSRPETALKRRGTPNGGGVDSKLKTKQAKDKLNKDLSM
jgi:hypothetical protein